MEPIRLWRWKDRMGVTGATTWHDSPLVDGMAEYAALPRADFDALAAEAADARTLRAERDSLVKERDEAREALAEERASRYPCNGPGELWRPLAMDDGPPRLYIFQRKRIDESDTPPSYMEISEEDGTLLLHYVKHGEADDSIIVECGADLPLRKMAEAARGDLDAATARADKAEAERDVAVAKAAVIGGEWCAANRAEGRGPCGSCSWCCAQATSRADAASDRLARAEALVAAAANATSVHADLVALLREASDLMFDRELFPVCNSAAPLRWRERVDSVLEKPNG